MAQIDITDKTTVAKIITDMESSENREFREAAWDAYNIYSGNQYAYTRDELKDIFPESWKTMTVSDVSVSRRIVGKVAKSYKQSPIRNLESDESTDEMTELYDDIKMDRHMKTFDAWFNLHNEALFFVDWREDEEKPQPMALQPYEYSVVIDPDTLRLIAVVLNYPDNSITGNTDLGQDGINQIIADSQADSAAEEKIYVIWSDDNLVVVKTKRERVQNATGFNFEQVVDFMDQEGNPNNENPYGMLPFVYLPKQQTSEKPIPSPLTRQSITFNTIWSFYLSSANLQGFGNLVISMPDGEGGGVENLATGLTTAIKLLQPTNPDLPPADAKYINPNPDLSGQREACLSYLETVLAEHGITGSAALTSDQAFNSGLERMIAEADVQNIVEDNQDRYAWVEFQLFEIIKRVLDTKASNPFGDQEISVIYPKPKVLVTDKETLENIKMMLDLGLIEKWEALVMRDPNLSPEDAQDKLERIEEERQGRLEMFTGMNNANNQNPGQLRAEAPEENGQAE